jgi:hypothetical protein
VHLVDAHYLTDELEHIQGSRHSQRFNENLAIKLA